MSIIFCAGALLAAAVAAGDAPAELALRDGWQLQSSSQLGDAGGADLSSTAFTPEGWHSVAVPATVLAGLVEAGVYPDPYYGTNLKRIPGYREAPWLVMPEDSPFRVPWWYRTSFPVPAEFRGKTCILHFGGINYRANIWLNGRQVASSDDVVGMFRRFEFDVSDRLDYGGDNVLAVEIIPPGQLPDIEYRTKQLEATTGWDDHNPYPPDMNMGLWQEVYLSATGPVRLKHPFVRTQLDVPGLKTARLTVSAVLVNDSDSAQTCTLSGAVESRAFSKQVTLEPGGNQEVTFTADAYEQLVINQPRVWWPHPLGPQELYDLNLIVEAAGAVSDAGHVRFGIRDATTVINDEGWRQYRINGQNILIRGGAWMTSDMLLRLTERRYDALVRYAREAGLNMLRSEGFSIRETEGFFNACDEMGVMVTQQIFGRNIEDEALAIAVTEDTILRIRNHPSLVHFLGHDETFPTPTLDAAYRDMIARYTPDRTYQPHSGAFDVDERFETGGTRTGTRELWTYAGPSHYYLRKEDGAWGFAQSGGIGGVFASLESIRRMLPEDQRWPLWTEAWSFHTVTQGGEYFDALLTALNDRYGKPDSLEELVTKGEAMNYESARGMYEAYARNKYSATGITTWKYNAAWPAALTWQYIDWCLVPTGAYYGAKKACEPLHIQYAYDDAGVYVVNSFYKAFNDLKATAVAYDFDLRERYRNSATVDVGPDGKALAFVVDLPEDMSTTHFLRLTLEQPDGTAVTDNFYWLSTQPDIPGKSVHGDGGYRIEPESRADLTALNNLPEATVSATLTVEAKGDERVARIHLKNDGDTLAFFMRLTMQEPGPTEVATIPGGGACSRSTMREAAPSFWSDNCFSLMPGESRDVTAAFRPKVSDDHLLALHIVGWNVGRTTASMPAGDSVEFREFPLNYEPDQLSDAE